MTLRVPEANTSVSGESYEEPININADGIAANGFYPQNGTSNDAAAGVERDASGNLSLKDALIGSIALANLGQVIGAADTVDLTTTAGLVTHVDVWWTAARAVPADRKYKIDITYDTSSRPTNVVESQYNVSGGLYRTLTTPITYSGEDISSVGPTVIT